MAKMDFLRRDCPVPLSSLSFLILLHCTLAFHAPPFLLLLPTQHHGTVTNFAPRISSRHTVRLSQTDSDVPPPSSPGDKIRESNGKRPSLNPTVINAVSEALLLRSSPSHPPSSGPMEVSSTATALEVAVAAGDLAARFVESRAESSVAVKGDEDSGAFTQEEAQLVAGRVVGVVMRFGLLEGMLKEKVRGIEWVSKYGEEGSFGMTKEELEQDGEGGERGQLDVRLKDDPLLRMCRAECLYALFLSTVELPTMDKIGQKVPGGSTVDFLDSDRVKVLLQ